MEKIWEFFENLDEFVYVSDMDSYELIYLNKNARESFGVSDAKAFAGKTCYEVLQRCAAPCSMCTNAQLKPGQFIKWNYYNPIIEQHLLLIDTMMVVDGRRCRFEIALDNSVREQSVSLANRYADMEMQINNAVGIALQKATPDESIQCLLEFIGHSLSGERAYIFERNADGGDDNTYEWVAAGVTPQKESLQKLPPEVCAPWYRQFRFNRHVIIRDLEKERGETIEPMLYEILKRQDIHSLIAMPLYVTKEAAAFYGVDNPPPEKLDFALGMLHIMGHFIEGAIRRRNLVRQLQDMSYRDQQTGFGNRHALRSIIDHVDQDKSMGIVFCDITGLKNVNDTLGHKEGDALIARCADCMRLVFSQAMLFRFGGDELVAVCIGVEEQEMTILTERFREELQKQDANMSVGVSYAPAGAVNFDLLMSGAETRMYRDKSLYYKTHGIDRRRQ